MIKYYAYIYIATVAISWTTAVYAEIFIEQRRYHKTVGRTYHRAVDQYWSA